MTRETRHLLVSGVPDAVSNQRLIDYFANYGRVQKAERLGESKVVVSFVDARTASKALSSDHLIGGSQLRTCFHDGPLGGVQRPSSDPRRPSTSQRDKYEHGRSRDGYAVSATNGGGGGGTNARHQRNGSDRSAQRWAASKRHDSSASRPSRDRRPHSNERNGAAGSAVHGKQPVRRAPVNRPSERRREHSPASSISRSPKSPASPRPSRRCAAARPPEQRGDAPSCSPSLSSQGSRARPSAASAGSSGCAARPSSSARAHTESPSAGGEEAVVVRNLPLRSTDSSLKDGLFFTFKRHGKVARVIVAGEAYARYALVVFKKGSDVERTISETNGEAFFGSCLRVEAAPATLLETADDNEKKPLERDMDEQHPRSSRTLYVGNLEARTSETALRERFGRYGSVVDVDVKNRETPAPFAFVQFADIRAVVRATRDADAHKITMGRNRLKVGFGKTLQSTTVWLDQLPDVEEEYLMRKMRMYGEVQDLLLDAQLHQALVTYAAVESAQDAVKQLKQHTRTIGNVYVHVDYGSTQLQDLFIDRMYRQKQTAPPEARTNGLVECAAPPQSNGPASSDLPQPRPVSRACSRASTSKLSVNGPATAPSQTVPSAAAAARRRSGSASSGSSNSDSSTSSASSSGSLSTITPPPADAAVPPPPAAVAAPLPLQPQPAKPPDRERVHLKLSASHSHSPAAPDGVGGVGGGAPDELNKLTQRRDSILSMLENLGADEAAAVDPSSAAHPQKKLSEVFDLGWLKRSSAAGAAAASASASSSTAKPVDPAPPTTPSRRQPTRQQSAMLESFEQQDEAAELAAAQAAAMETDAHDAESTSFRRRRPKQFQPRQSSCEDVAATSAAALVSPPARSRVHSETAAREPTTAARPELSRRQSSATELLSKRPEPVPNPSTPSTSAACSVSARAKAPGRESIGSAEKSGAAHSSGHSRNIPKPIPLDDRSDIFTEDPRQRRPTDECAVVRLPLPAFARACTRAAAAAAAVTPDTPQESAAPVGGHAPLVGHRSASRSASGSSDAAMLSPQSSAPPPTTDIFGNSLTSPSGAAGSAQFDSPGRPSLEERIKALDASFSSLDQKMQAAKRNTSLDYSRFVVKKKEPPATPAAAWSTTRAAPVDADAKPPPRVKTDIFEQDQQRLRLADEPPPPPPQTVAATHLLDSVSTEGSDSGASSAAALAQTKTAAASPPPLDAFPSRRSSDATTAFHFPAQHAAPLSIQIPQHHHQTVSAQSSAAVTPTGGGGGGGVLSPPLQSILKKPKTPSTAPPLVPFFNTSIPPPPLPAPVTPTDPRVRRDPLRSPDAAAAPAAAPAAVLPASAPPFARLNVPPPNLSRIPVVTQSPISALPGAKSWQNRGLFRQNPCAESKQNHSNLITAPTVETAPRSAYNVDPRRLGSAAIFGQTARTEKTFGLRHDDRGAPSSSSSSSSRPAPPSAPPRADAATTKRPSQSQKEARMGNKELDALFKKQAADPIVRVPLPKIKRKPVEQPPAKPPPPPPPADAPRKAPQRAEEQPPKKDKEKGVERQHHHSHGSHKPSPSMSEAERVAAKQLKKSQHEQKEKEAARARALLRERDEARARERAAEKGRKRRKAASSSDESESDSTDSDADESKTLFKSFELDIQKIMAEEMASGQSMYDRLKRRSSAMRGTGDGSAAQSNFLNQLKEERNKKAGKGGKGRQRVRMSSDEDDVDEEDEDMDKATTAAAERENSHADRKHERTKSKMNFDDVFGTGDGDSEAERAPAERDRPSSDADERPPPKKARLENASSKAGSDSNSEARKEHEKQKKRRIERAELELARLKQKLERRKQAKEERRKEKELKRKRRKLEKEAQRADDSERAAASPPPHKLVTKGALKAMASSQGQPQPPPPPAQSSRSPCAQTLDTNERLPSDLVVALNRARSPDAEASAAEPVEVTEYAEVEVEVGVPFLLVDQKGVVQECVLAPDDDDASTASAPAAAADAHVPTGDSIGDTSDSRVPDEPVVKEDVESPAAECLPVPQTATAATSPPPPPAPVIKEEQADPVAPVMPAESSPEVPVEKSRPSPRSSHDSDQGSHTTLSEQRSDVSITHVDEVIDHIVRGYVEIDAAQLIQMRQPKKAPPDEIDETINEVSRVHLPPAPAAAFVGAPLQPLDGGSQRPRHAAADAMATPPSVAAFEHHHQFLMQQQQQHSQQASAQLSRDYLAALAVAPAAASGLAPGAQISPLPAGLGSYAAPPHAAFPNGSGLCAPPTPASAAAVAATPHFGYDPQTRALLEMQQQQQQAVWAAAGGRLPAPTSDQMELQHRLWLHQQQQLGRVPTTNVPPPPAVSVAPQSMARLPPTPTAYPTAVSAPMPAIPAAPTPTPTPPTAGAAKILDKYPVRWQGNLSLKNTEALVQMHYIAGNHDLIGQSLAEAARREQGAHVLKINQRMRCEPSQLDGVHRRMQSDDDYCVLLALPCGHSPNDILNNSQTLKDSFIEYLQQKQAAGIVNVPMTNAEGQQVTAYVVHIFPPCDFSQLHLLDKAQDFLQSVNERHTSYLFVVITTVPYHYV